MPETLTSSARPRASARPTTRTYATATGYGALAGVVTALTFLLMKALEHALWQGREGFWTTWGIIMTGGVLVALLRPYSLEADLPAQLELRGESHQWKRVAVLGLSAVIAVGCGGAIGPEAGLIAVVTEMSVLVSYRIRLSETQAALLRESAQAAALSGFYGAPPAGAVIQEEDARPSRLPVYTASLAGFVTFLLTYRLLGGHPHPITFPEGSTDPVVDLLSFVPALAGAALGYLYLVVKRVLRDTLALVPRARWQTIVGTLVLATLLAFFPVLRFSGHDDFGVIPAYAAAEGGALVLLALGKAVATSLSLASGWRGGDVFPLMLAGAAAGAAVVPAVPSLGLPAAMVAGMCAASVIALGKPVAVFVLLLFLVPSGSLVVLVVATLVSALASRLVPARLAPAH
nr:chloride channel protein [Actinomyces sp.]